MHKGLLAITKGANFEFFKVKLTNIANLNLKKFPKEIQKLFGKEDISRECDFKCKDYTISVFAFQNGKAGQENKFELPPPIDTALYFGCLIVIAHNNDKIITITREMFNEFYDKVFDGFVNLDGEDTWSEEEEENTEDREFIVDDNYIEYESNHTTTEDEDDSYEEETEEETEEEEVSLESETDEDEDELGSNENEEEVLLESETDKDEDELGSNENEEDCESTGKTEEEDAAEDKNIGIKIKINII